MIQAYVISPRIMGISVELHPPAALFGILAGGEIAGILGVYLSIPVMASLRIVWRRWRIYAEKRKFGPLNEYSFPQELGQSRTYPPDPRFPLPIHPSPRTPAPPR